jgi:hypothetical protein
MRTQLCAPVTAALEPDRPPQRLPTKPHVNEFQEGKIVFATSRAVGKILYMKQEGDTVSVILGPIQLMDVIHKAEFATNAPLLTANAYISRGLRPHINRRTRFSTIAVTTRA